MPYKSEKKEQAKKIQERFDNRNKKPYLSKQLPSNSDYAGQINQAHDLIKSIIEYNGGVAKYCHSTLLFIINEIVHDADGTIECLGSNHSITTDKLKKISKVTKQFQYILDQLKSNPKYHETKLGVFLESMFEYTIFNDW